MKMDAPERGLFEDLQVRMQHGHAPVAQVTSPSSDSPPHPQEQLERSTEHLAELTEKPVDKMDRGDVSGGVI